MTTSMTGSRRRLTLRWLATIVGFTIGGFIGHLVAAALALWTLAGGETRGGMAAA